MPIPFLPDDDRVKIKAFVLAEETEQDLMRACALLSHGKPALRQPTFVLGLLRDLEARKLIHFARGGYALSPGGKAAKEIYLATARAVMRSAGRVG